MISSNNVVSLRRQCELLEVPRSMIYYTPKSTPDSDLIIMNSIDKIYTKYPFYGARRIVHCLKQEGFALCRSKVSRLMRMMGITAIYPKPKTSMTESSNKKYPYLLNGLEVNNPNHVWCTDITYLPMVKGFMYLVAIMDWYSRKILTWRLSNSLDVSFCLEALEESLLSYENPSIFNTDQGAQFTSVDFTKILIDNKIRISMDGKGRWMDNIFIERFWRSLKYEFLYLQEFDAVKPLAQGIAKYVEFYNNDRPHQTFDGLTPNMVYNNTVSFNHAC